MIYYSQTRTLFENLNKGGKFFTDDPSYSVDEIMVPYIGRISAKQFIYGKPVCYWYKIWSICTSNQEEVKCSWTTSSLQLLEDWANSKSSKLLRSDKTDSIIFHSYTELHFERENGGLHSTHGLYICLRCKSMEAETQAHRKKRAIHF